MSYNFTAVLNTFRKELTVAGDALVVCVIGCRCACMVVPAGVTCKNVCPVVTAPGVETAVKFCAAWPASR